MGTRLARHVKWGGQVKKKRRQFRQERPLAERLAEEAKRLRAAARSIQPGARRAELMRRAQQAESGVEMAKWLGSPKSSEATVEDAEVRGCQTLGPT